MPRPKVGLLPWIALPSLSRIFAWFASPERSRIVPAAASTSGSARTLASTSGEICALPVCDHSTSFLPRDDGVGLLVRAREDRVERLVDRVGEDERAADHRDAEDDRDRRQRGAELAREQAAEGDAPHRSATSLRASRISVCDERPSSLTITPSARKRTRSAIVAARGSCVTITVVWPYVSTAPRRRPRISARGLRVEVARRLVGEQHGRLGDERAGHRDALLLAAGELGGPVRRRSARPVASSSSSIHCRARASRRRSRAAGGCSPRRESIGSRLKNWKTKPMCARRSFVSVVVLERRQLDARRSRRCRRSAGRGRRGCASASTCRSPTGP